jgi:methyltransferase
MVTVTIYLILLGLIGLERLFELFLSHRNEAWVRKKGAREFGAKHFGLMKALHTTFLISCAAEVVFLERPFHPELGLPMFALLLLAQMVRYWSVFTLGRYWNVRVLVVPEAGLVDKGPYRYLRHPNYLAVILEGFAIPLVHSAWITAATFSLMNGLLLTARIRCEEKALEEHSAYKQQFSTTPRFFPARRGLTRK